MFRNSTRQKKVLMPFFLNVQFFLTQTTLSKIVTNSENYSLCDDIFCYPNVNKNNVKELFNLTRALLTLTEDLLQDEKNSENISFHPLTLETKSLALGSLLFPSPKCLLVLIAKKVDEKEEHLPFWKGFKLPIPHEEKMPLTLMLRCVCHRIFLKVSMIPQNKQMLHRFYHHFFLFYNEENFQRSFSFETLVKNYITHFVPRFFSNPTILKLNLPPYYLYSENEEKLSRPLCSIMNLRLWNFIYQLKSLQLLEKKGSIFHSGCMFYKDHYMGGTIKQFQAGVIYDCLFQSNQTSKLFSGTKKKGSFSYENINNPCFYNLCDLPEEMKQSIDNATWIGYLYGNRKTKVIKRKTSETFEFVNDLLNSIEKDLLVIPRIFLQKNPGLYLIVFKYEEISFLMLYNQLPFDDCVTLQNTPYGIFGASITLSAWFSFLTKFLCNKEFGLPIFLKKIRSALQEPSTQNQTNASSIMVFDNVQKWSNLFFTHTSMPCINKKRIDHPCIIQKNKNFSTQEEKNIVWILYNVFNFPYSETLETICVKFKNTQRITLHQDFHGSFSYHIGTKKTSFNHTNDEFLNKTLLEYF